MFPFKFQFDKMSVTKPLLDFVKFVTCRGSFNQNLWIAARCRNFKNPNNLDSFMDEYPSLNCNKERIIKFSEIKKQLHRI